MFGELTPNAPPTQPTPGRPHSLAPLQDPFGEAQRLPRPTALLEKKIDRLHALLLRESNKENDPSKLRPEPLCASQAMLEKVEGITAAVLELRAANEHYRRLLSQDLTVCVQELRGTVARMRDYFEEWDKVAAQNQ